MSQILPKFPVKIGFDIENKKETKHVWAHPMARILALLWRPCHIANQYYWPETLEIGLEIARLQPKSADELVKCFYVRGSGARTNYPVNDVSQFAKVAIDYFTGKKQVQYEISV